MSDEHEGHGSADEGHDHEGHDHADHAGHDHGDPDGHDHEGHDHEGHDHEGHDHDAHDDHDDHSGGHHAPDPNEGVVVGEPPTPAWVMSSVVIGIVTLIAVLILGIALDDQVPDRLAPADEGVAPVTAEH